MSKRHPVDDRFWLGGQSRNGHQSFDQPEPRRGRTHRGDRVDRFHGRLFGTSEHSRRRECHHGADLDWFEAAKAVIVEEVERQHWRLWNGKAANAQVSIDCTHAVMHHFKGEADARKSAQLSPPSSVRNTPAADMAMNMRCGFPGSSKTECRHMPPAPGCQAGPVPCLRNPDSSCQVWPPSLDWNNAASSIPAWRWCTCRKAGDLAPVLSRYAMTRRRRTDFGRPAASIRFKDRHADGSLCLLRGETACAQPRSDQRLVAAHGRFDERELAIAGGGLPGKSPSFPDHFQMVITLCRLIPFAAGHRRRARRNHNVDVIAAVRRDRLVSGVTIIRAICRHSGDPVVNLIQQRRYLRRIVRVLIRKHLRHHHAAACIPPPDAVCAISGATSRHVSPPAIDPPHRPADRHYLLTRTTNRAAVAPTGSPAASLRDG